MKAKKPLLFCLVPLFVSLFFQTANGQVGNKSDIVTDGGEMNCISSLTNGTVTTPLDGVQVWKFKIRDGGVYMSDADILPTIITQLIITQGVSNTVADWNNIQSIGLFDGNVLLANGAVSSNNISFGSLLLTVPDNESKSLSIRLTIKTSLLTPGLIDGKAFRFSIIPSNITTGIASSLIDNTMPVATTISGTNTICVTATKLMFINQPTTTGLNNPMSPIIKIGAFDVNNNLDLGFVQPVSLASSGTMVGTMFTESAINGIATFPSVKHSALASAIKLTTTATGITNSISATFNIIPSTTFALGDFAIIGVNTTWTNAPALPASNNSRADEISFVVFQDVQPGTLFYMTDNGYGRNTPNTFGVTEGLISFTRTGTVLPAGSIITIRGNGGTAAEGGVGSNYDNRSFVILKCGSVDNDWTVAVNLLGNNIIGFDLNPTDQVWFMQGGNWIKSGTGASDSSTYSNGNVLYGWSGINWKTATGITSPTWTTSGSIVYPKTKCFINTLNGTGGVSKVKYTGGGIASNFTATTKLGWIARIDNPANWSTYQSTGGINVSYDNYNGNMLYQAVTTPNTDYAGYTVSPLCSFTVTAATEADGNWKGSVSTDWFDCNNWETKTVPDSITDVTISNTAINNCIVDKTSPTAYMYNNKADCLDLILNNKTIATGNIADSINVNGNFTMQNNAVLDMTNGGVFSLKNGSWSKSSSTFISGIGTVIYGSAGTQTIIAENYNSLISTSTGNRILPSAGTIGIKSIFNPNYPNQAYSITNSTIDFNGINSNQTIPAFNFYNVGFKNGGIKTLMGNDTVYNIMSIGSNMLGGDGTILTLNTNDFTLHSDNVATAAIAPIATTGAIPCGINYQGTGRFIVERYLPMSTSYMSRRWRLLTAPVSSIDAPTIKNSWQEGVTNTNREQPVNSNPGHGTTITLNTSSVNGYDQGSTNNPSLYKLIPGQSSWVAPLATDVGKITDNQGYMLFARGDRSIIVSNQYINTTGGTTLRVKGQVNTGDISIPLVTGKQVIANPYPSAISFNGIDYNNSKPGITTGSSYYLWDPKLLGSGGVGGWVTFSSAGNNTYSIVPNPTDSLSMSQYSNNGTIESGVAFVVDAAEQGAITIHETDKINSNTTIGLASRPADITNIKELYINLSYVNAAGKPILSDGAAVVYADGYHDELDLQDVKKIQLFSQRERIGIMQKDNLLAIERRASINETDTIQLMDLVASGTRYQLQFRAGNLYHPLHPVLEDRFTKTSVNINPNGITGYDFTTTTDIASTASNRFYIVFKKNSPVPVTFISVQAAQQNNNVLVQWQVTNLQNIKSYIIEKSMDGIHFQDIASVIATDKPTTKYSLTDTVSAKATYYYRIQAVDNKGFLEYSHIAKTTIGNTKSSVQIYPNPVIGDVIKLRLTQMVKGFYKIELLTNEGQVIWKNILMHAGGDALKEIAMEHIPNGIYQLKIIKPDGETISFKITKL